MADQVLSVIIPVKDEAATIAELVELVQSADVPGFDKQVLIVDDGSTDGTAAVLEQYEGRDGFVLLRHEQNQGKGAAVRTAIPHVAGAVVVIQDADHEYEPNDFAALVEPIRTGRTRVAYGSRFLGTIENMAWPNRLANRLLSTIASRLGPSRITDEATCYKAFDADLLRSLPLRCHRFEFCPEVTGLLQGAREPIVEVPIRYVGRNRSAGKKVRAKDGFTAVRWLLWCRFGRRADQRAIAASPPRARLP